MNDLVRLRRQAVCVEDRLDRPESLGGCGHGDVHLLRFNFVVNLESAVHASSFHFLRVHRGVGGALESLLRVCRRG